MKTAFRIAGWLIVASLMGIATETSAQSTGILTIKPAPGVPGAGLGAAQIDEMISTEEIVIDDMHFRIARDATFFDKGHQREVSLYFFKVGDRVRYTTNDQGEIEDLWVFSEDAP
jgi:hypothetical protein